MPDWSRHVDSLLTSGELDPTALAQVREEVSEHLNDRYHTLLAEGMHLTGTGGCDAHEDAFPGPMPDGERGDSYRRMMHWHTHHLLVSTMDRAGVRSPA